jgi:putative aminopeptidase FrvX
MIKIQNIRSNHPLTMGARQLQLLEKLSNASSVSGDEGAVRSIILEEVKPYANKVTVDAMGNILVTCQTSSKPQFHLMMSAHMDEVGLMLIDKDEDGIYRFETVGGMDIRQLVGKPVVVGSERIMGIIGAKPIHLMKEKDLDQIMPLESLRIDIGLDKEGKVQVGDRATFATSFQKTGPSLRGKALDNRLGVVILLELVKNHPSEIEFSAAFTVQEEIGARGAKTAAFSLNPDMAIIIDATPAQDMPAWDDSENTTYNTRLDAGPAIYLADGTTLYDPRLVRFFAAVAEKQHIPYQFRQPGKGGTDAGTVHRQRTGIPTSAISVPIRYSHTAISLCRQTDWQNTLTLLHCSLQELDPSILKTNR